MATLSNSYLFFPQQFPNCVLWLDGADPNTVILSSGSNVSQWSDKSGNNNHAVQATSSNQATYNSLNYAITFNAANSTYMTLNNPSVLPSGANVNGTFFFVTQNTTAATQVFFMYGPNVMVTGANPQFYYNGTPNLVVDTYGAGANTDGTNVLNTTTLETITLSSSGGITTVSGWRTGNSFSGGSSNTTTVSLTSQYASLGASALTNTTNRTFYFTGNIYEIIIYSNVLNTSQRQQVEAYLSWKYNIQTQLPTSHPYYYNPAIANLVLSAPIQSVNNCFNTSSINAILPNQISGLSLWLDSADRNTLFSDTAGTLPVSTINQSVALWRDKSPNAYNATNATVSNRPTWSGTSGGILFNPTNSGAIVNTTQFLSNTAASISIASHSIFIVQSQNSVTTINRFFSIGNNAADYQGSGIAFGNIFNPYTSCIIYGLNSGNYFGTFTTTTPWPKRIYSDVYAPKSGSGFLSGSNVYSLNTTPGNDFGTTTYYYAGCGNVSGPTGYFNGNIFEIIVYNTALTPLQRQQIESYLSWKWNIQTNLQISHPYYFNPLLANIRLANQIINTTLSLNAGTLQPTRFTGLALWLDAADTNSVVLNAGSVSQWNDKSGNGRNAIPTGNPTYVGLNISLTNGSYFIGNINIASGALQTTGFCVAISPASFSNVNRLLSVNDGAGFDYNAPSGFVYSSGASTGGVMNAYRNVAAQTTGTVQVNTRFMITTIYNSSGVFTFSINGNFPSGSSILYASNTNTTTTNTLTKYYIGVNSLLFQTWNGSVNEFIIFNRTLTQSEYQQVEGYLAWKWGLQNNLPSTHPYALFPPN